MDGDGTAGGGEETSETGGAPSVEVLHVDDDPTMAETTAKFLALENDRIAVTVETHPEDALERLRDERFDCIVSDYQMPDLNGLEFLESVRADHPDIPFILFTGKGSESIASDAISAGVTDYLQKNGGHEQYSVLARQVTASVEHLRAVERFEGFLESAPDAILVADTDGAITKLNKQTETMFGYDRSELVGEPIERLIPSRFSDQHVEHRNAYFEDPETRPMGADFDLYARRADGSEFPVDISLSPIQIGDHVEVMAAIRDISTRKWREEELRERERQLERQNERLDEFASVVSHDLNNLLSTATGSTELARRSGDSSHLDRVEEALGRMGELTENLLSLARDGQTVDEPEPVAPESEARPAWRTAKEEGAELRLVDCGAEILADPSRLKQIFENLFYNAIQHGGDGVTVRVGVEDGRLFVADDGPGIPEAEREQIFEYGYSGRPDGSGYGLAIVRSIVEAHDWDIEATESRDGGARFEIGDVDVVG
jgi:PAS domain S-box-containing protein